MSSELHNNVNLTATPDVRLYNSSFNIREMLVQNKLEDWVHQQLIVIVIIFTRNRSLQTR